MSNIEKSPPPLIIFLMVHPKFTNFVLEILIVYYVFPESYKHDEHAIMLLKKKISCCRYTVCHEDVCILRLQRELNAVGTTLVKLFHLDERSFMDPCLDFDFYRPISLYLL